LFFISWAPELEVQIRAFFSHYLWLFLLPFERGDGKKILSENTKRGRLLSRGKSWKKRGEVRSKNVSYIDF
jgi:hypothetical protein